MGHVARYLLSRTGFNRNSLQGSKKIQPLSTQSIYLLLNNSFVRSFNQSNNVLSINIIHSFMYFNLSMFTSSWQKNLVVNFFLIFFTDLIAVWLHINSIKSNRITNLLPPSHRSLRNLRCIMTLHPSPRLRGFPSPNYSQWRIHRKSLHRMLSSRLNRHLMRDISIRTL